MKELVIPNVKMYCDDRSIVCNSSGGVPPDGVNSSINEEDDFIFLI